MNNRRSLIVSLCAAAVFGLFGPPGPGSVSADVTTKVVASFSILGDMVKELGGDRVDVTTLVGPDGDGHVYQPTPADARSVAETQLLVVNGLGFEGWMDRLTEAAGYKGPVVAATTGIEPLQIVDDAEENGQKTSDGARADQGPGRIDPHAWQSLANARIYVQNIADGLVTVDPAGAELYRNNAARFLEEIDALEAQIREAFASLPAERRKVVTSHDAFGYFSSAYGIEFHAPVGVNTEAEASAGDVANLIRQIEKEQITAVFVENISDRRLLEQIVRETGAHIGGTLYSDALSTADGPAGTYLDMMRHNAETLAAALGG